MKDTAENGQDPSFFREMRCTAGVGAIIAAACTAGDAIVDLANFGVLSKVGVAWYVISNVFLIGGAAMLGAACAVVGVYLMRLFVHLENLRLSE